MRIGITSGMVQLTLAFALPASEEQGSVTLGGCWFLRSGAVHLSTGSGGDAMILLQSGHC